MRYALQRVSCYWVQQSYIVNLSVLILRDVIALLAVLDQCTHVPVGHGDLILHGKVLELLGTNGVHAWIVLKELFGVARAQDLHALVEAAVHLGMRRPREVGRDVDADLAQAKSPIAREAHLAVPAVELGVGRLGVLGEAAGSVVADLVPCHLGGVGAQPLRVGEGLDVGAVVERAIVELGRDDRRLGDGDGREGGGQRRAAGGQEEGEGCSGLQHGVSAGKRKGEWRIEGGERR